MADLVVAQRSPQLSGVRLQVGSPLCTPLTCGDSKAGNASSAVAPPESSRGAGADAGGGRRKTMREMEIWHEAEVAKDERACASLLASASLLLALDTGDPVPTHSGERDRRTVRGQLRLLQRQQARGDRQGGPGGFATAYRRRASYDPDRGSMRSLLLGNTTNIVREKAHMFARTTV